MFLHEYYIQGIFLNTGNTIVNKQAKFSAPQGAHLPVELETVCKGVKHIVWHVVTAIAYLGRYNKVPHSGWLIRFCWSHLWRLGSPRSRYQHGWPLGMIDLGRPSWLSASTLLLCPCIMWGAGISLEPLL